MRQFAVPMGLSLLLLMVGCGTKLERTLRGTWTLNKIERKLYVNDQFSDINRPTVTGTITFAKGGKGSYDLSINYMGEKVESFEWNTTKEENQTMLLIDAGRWTKAFGMAPAKCTILEWSGNELRWERIDTLYYRNNAVYKWVEEWSLSR